MHNRSIALFIDLQNSHRFSEALDCARKMGQVEIARAYGRKDQLTASKRNQIEAANIDFIDVVCQSGKNSVDIRIVIDVMEYALTKKHISAIAICADDGDYRHLVTRLLSFGKEVILVCSREPRRELYTGLPKLMIRVLGGPVPAAQGAQRTSDASKPAKPPQEKGKPAPERQVQPQRQPSGQNGSRRGPITAGQSPAASSTDAIQLLRDICLQVADLSPLGAPPGCIEELYRRSAGEDIRSSQFGVRQRVEAIARAAAPDAVLEDINGGRFLKRAGSPAAPAHRDLLESRIAVRAKFLRPIVASPAPMWMRYVERLQSGSAGEFLPAQLAVAAAESFGLPSLYGKTIMRVLLGTDLLEEVDPDAPSQATEKLLYRKHKSVDAHDVDSFVDAYMFGLLDCLTRGPGGKSMLDVSVARAALGDSEGVIAAGRLTPIFEDLAADDR